MPLIADAPLSLRNAILAVNVLLAVFLLGVGYSAVRARRRRPVHAPNQTEYHGDDTLEGARLERVQGWAVAMSALIAVSLPAYWLIEPDRQELATENLFNERSVEQGAALYAVQDEASNPNGLGCAGCHGPEGQGGAAPPQIVRVPLTDLEVGNEALASSDRVCAPDPDDDEQLLCQVTWQAPALDTVFLRFSRDEVTEIVTFGRPGTPMPAWGLEGGGAKNEQSIENIVDFLESIQIDSDEAKAQLAGTTDGRALFEASCARCHTKHWSYAQSFVPSEGEGSPADLFDIFSVPGGGAFGPNLTGDVTLRQFPDIEDHVQFIVTGSDFQAAYGTRGIGSGRMPGFGRVLTNDQIRAIVEYERGLGEDRRDRLDDRFARPGSGGGGETGPDAEGEGGGAT